MLRILLVISAFLSLGATTTTPAPSHPEIMRLLVGSVGDEGTDFIVFAYAPAAAVQMLRNQGLYLYCVRLTKDTKNWRFFLPCGKTTPIFGSTVQISSFPNLGKIEEVLSGRPMRFRKAVVLAISSIPPHTLPQAHPSSIKEFIETQISEHQQEFFIGIDVLRYGSL